MKVIGLCGPAGVGKDTLATLLLIKYGGERRSFAAPIKDALCAMLNIDMDYFEDRDLKEKTIPGMPEGVSPRMLAQTLGTEWGRHIVHPDFWGILMDREKQALEKAGCPLLVIPDVRFDNEAQKILNYGGIILRLHREGVGHTVRPHVSERPITESAVTEVVKAEGMWSLDDVKCLGPYMEKNDA